MSGGWGGVLGHWVASDKTIVVAGVCTGQPSGTLPLSNRWVENRRGGTKQDGGRSGVSLAWLGSGGMPGSGQRGRMSRSRNVSGMCWTIATLWSRADIGFELKRQGSLVHTNSHLKNAPRLHTCTQLHVHYVLLASLQQKVSAWVDFPGNWSSLLRTEDI